MNNLKTKPWNNAEKIALAAILIFVALIRLRLLDYPFERDEGEYAYFGQLILEGIPPYKMAYHMKLPGTYFMYAFFMGIFGQTVRGAHIGLLIVNLCSILFLFSLVKKILGGFAALVAAGTLGILSVNVGVIGNAGHATHFVTMFALAGILLLYKAEKNGKKTLYFWSGVLLALSPIMKQSEFFFRSLELLI